MYCLRKKYIYFSNFFLFSDHLTVFFFHLFRNMLFVSIIFHQKKKTLFVLIGHKLLLLPCSDNLLPSFKVIIKKNAQKEIIHSYHFGFYKLIQSHMCYTGLELEHCKIVFLNPVIFNSWLHERTGNSNDVIRIPPTDCLFFFLSSVMLFVVSCFCFIFLSFHTEVRHTEYSSYIYKRN